MIIFHQLGASNTKITLEMQSFMKSYDEKG